MRAAPEIRALTGLRALPALLVVLYHFYRWHVPAVPIAPVATSVLFVVALLCADLVPFAYLTTDVLAPVFAAMVVAVATLDGTRSLVSRGLQLPAVMLLGRASYSVYILQVPVFYVFLHFLPQMWDSAPLFWPYLGVLVVVSIAAYAFVEEPARRALSPRR